MRDQRIYVLDGPSPDNFVSRIAWREWSPACRWFKAIDPTLTKRVVLGSTVTVENDAAHFTVFDQQPPVDQFGNPNSPMAAVSGWPPRLTVESVPLNGHDPDDFGVRRFGEPSPLVGSTRTN